MSSVNNGALEEMSEVIPENMRAVEVVSYGDADQLQLTERPVPQPHADEVLIRIKAAGVSRPDVFQRQGLYPPPPGVSDIPGLEAAGEIVAVGEKVKQWQVGDNVCALLAGGGYAEYAVSNAHFCLPIPEPLGFIEAAGIPEAFFTVWRNIFDIAGLQAGETLLVHGGSSGIGTSAIQIAKEMGVRVFTTTGSDDKCQRCESLGAERAINYHKEDFVPVLKEIVGKHGINVTLDIVGGDYIERNLQIAAVGGRIVYIGFLQNAVANVNFMPMMLKQVTLTGSTLRWQSTEIKGQIAAALYQQVWPLLEQGTIAPAIYQSMPLAQAADAHRLMETNEHTGKIILTCD